MRRRHTINVWPAFADLMTVLAVVSLFTTLALAHFPSSEKDLIAHLQELEQARRKLEEEQGRLELEREKEKTNWDRERGLLRRQIREAARNEKMFQAIQEAQRLIDEISRSSGLVFGPDQSLQFGDDLVSFNLNSVEPIWRADSRERLERFCRSISGQLTGSHSSLESKDRFIVQVEGHTDSIGCPSSPSCNWWISSGRAANFVAVMKNAQYCPGGSLLNMRPIGFADTRAVAPGAQPTRRIAVRLIPNYEMIIKALSN